MHASVHVTRNLYRWNYFTLNNSVVTSYFKGRVVASIEIILPISSQLMGSCEGRISSSDPELHRREASASFFTAFLH